MTISAVPIVLPGSAEPVTVQGDLYLCLFALTFSGSYVVGGDTVDFLAAWPGGSVPSQIIVVDIAGGAGNAFEYVLPATNKKLKMFTAANTEGTAVAYNAAITGDTNIVAQVYAK